MKTKLLLSFLLLLKVPAMAQFTFPVVPEHIFPAANLNVGYANETSCFHSKVEDYDGTGEQNLYVYAWSGNNRSYLAWRRDNFDNSVTYDENFFPMSPFYRNIEVGIYQWGGITHVVAAYYSSAPGAEGHYYEIFDFTAGGLVPSGAPQQISNSLSYGRISLDVHRADEVVMVWRDNQVQSLMVKLIHSGAPTPTKIISNTQNAISPDVAIGCTPESSPAGGTIARIVYFNQNSGQIIVSSRGLQQIGAAGTTIAFTLDDVNIPALPAQYFDHTSLNIDCPVHYDRDNWSYIYTDNYFQSARARVRTNPLGTPVITTYTLTQGLFGPMALTNNQFYTTGIAYSQSGSDIYYGWYYGDGNQGNPNVAPGASGWYVAVNLREDGTPAVPEYQCIVDPTLLGVDYSWLPSPVAFSKKTETNDHLFIVYPVVSTQGVVYMATKQIRWNQTAFKPGTTPVQEPVQNELQVSVFPNPFRDRLNIDIAGADQHKTYEAQLTDLRGSVLAQLHGNAAILREQIAAKSKHLVPGLYLLRLGYEGQNSIFKIMKSN